MVEKKQKGNLTELQCITAFYEIGYSVSIPYGENSRYDFIADVNGHLIRIQVKTSSTKDDGKTYTFSCRSSRTNSYLPIFQGGYTGDIPAIRCKCSHR